MESANTAPQPLYPAASGPVSIAPLRAGSRPFREFFRYFVASAVALALDFAVLSALVEWQGMHYLGASALGFASGTVAAFIISSRWAFARHSYSHWASGLVLFLVIGISGLIVNSSLVWLGADVAGLDYRLAKLAAAGGSFLFNFYARKAALFS